MIPEFRAWDKVDKVIREVTAIDWSLDLVEFMHGAIERSFDDVILMQSTGLKDKNAVEIFEGGIIKTKTGTLQSVEYVRASVTKDWSETVAAFKCRQGDEYFYFDLATDEVIGNIYENSELLYVEG